jgi:hypothetical protein
MLPLTKNQLLTKILLVLLAISMALQEGDPQVA